MISLRLIQSTTPDRCRSTSAAISELDISSISNEYLSCKVKYQAYKDRWGELEETVQQHYLERMDLHCADMQENIFHLYVQTAALN